MRREADLDLALARRRAGLVVDQRRAAAGEEFDAVGARGQRERRAVGEGERELARALDQNALAPRRRARVEIEEGAEPVEDARPADGAEIRVGEQRREPRLGNRDEARPRFGGRSAVADALAERLQRGVPDVADLARAGLGRDRRERRQAEDPLGVNRVRVAPQRLDAGDAEPARPQRDAAASARDAVAADSALAASSPRPSAR